MPAGTIQSDRNPTPWPNRASCTSVTLRSKVTGAGLLGRSVRRRPAITVPLVPVPLDAAVGPGRSPAVAARDDLGRAERREHGDAPRIGEDFIGWTPPIGS